MLALVIVVVLNEVQAVAPLTAYGLEGPAQCNADSLKHAEECSAQIGHACLFKKTPEASAVGWARQRNTGNEGFWPSLCLMNDPLKYINHPPEDEV